MPGEWSAGRRTYPLMISQEVDQAVVRFRAEHNLSQGKALNVLIRRGLETEGFLQPMPTKEEEEKKAREVAHDFVRKNWEDMPPKSRLFYLRKYPELEAEFGKREQP